MPYFSNFPLTSYDINNRKLDYMLITDVLFRTKLLASILNNASSYYNYSLKDGETPEIIADKYYDDPYAEWIVMYANNVIDPRYDWFMGYSTFQKYLVEKYGSIATAETQIHHYERVTTTTDTRSETISTRRAIIDYEDYRDVIGDVPAYDNYTDLASYTLTTPEGTFRNGGSVRIEVTKEAITCHDWEVEQNENKRLIRLIDKQYRPQIEKELETLGTTTLRRNYVRNAGSI